MAKYFLVLLLCLYVSTIPKLSAEEVAGFDDVAIQNAINAAEVGETIVFPQGVYTVTKRIVPKSEQTLLGDGAVIFRAAPKITTLIASVAVGDTTIQVADSSIYEVGNTITPVRPGGGNADIEVKVHFIVNIQGNSITVNRPFESSYESGAFVTNYFNVVESGEPFTIDGLVFLGQRQLQVFSSWRRNRNILGFEGLQVRNCRFENLPGDAIDAWGGNAIIEDNVFTDLDAAGVHLSNDVDEEEDVIIRNNVFVRTNEKHLSAGHSEGAITVSLRNNHIRVLNNQCFNIPAAFIGNFHVDMGDWTVSGNLVVNAERGFFRGSNNNNGPLPLAGVVFSSNTILDSPLSVMDTLLPVEGFFLEGNRFIGSAIRLVDVFGIVMDNEIKVCEEVAIEIINGGVGENGNLIDEGYCEASFTVGDMNLDGVVSLLDVNLFVDALSQAYYNPLADMNSDDQNSLLDVQPFIDALNM